MGIALRVALFLSLAFRTIRDWKPFLGIDIRPSGFGLSGKSEFFSFWFLRDLQSGNPMEQSNTETETPLKEVRVQLHFLHDFYLLP